MKSPESSKRPRKLKPPFLLRRIVGHSMMPVLPPGTLVLGWSWFRRLRPGDVVVFYHDGKEKIKRVGSIEEDGRLHMIGDHPSASRDSRHFGTVERSFVVSKVIFPGTRLKP